MAAKIVTEAECGVLMQDAASCTRNKRDVGYISSPKQIKQCFGFSVEPISPCQLDDISTYQETDYAHHTVATQEAACRPQINCGIKEAKRSHAFKEGEHYHLYGRLHFTFHPNDAYTISCINADKKEFYFTSELADEYLPFANDWGPNNISTLVRFCRCIRAEYNHPKLLQRKLIYYMEPNTKSFTNTALLLAAWLVFDQKLSPEEAVQPFMNLTPCPLIEFVDATYLAPTFTVDVLSCLRGLRKAVDLGMVTDNPEKFVDEFNCDEYDQWHDCTGLNMNKISPKFYAFAGPQRSNVHSLTRKFSKPAVYFLPALLSRRVAGVVRLNEPSSYPSSTFTDAGIQHLDLFFEDCTVPSPSLVKTWLDVCDATGDSPLAVHCFAGLGRTGTLIGVHLIKHNGFTAKEVIGFLRLMRPGSVIGLQQQFLEAVERCTWDGNMMVFAEGDSKVSWEDDRAEALSKDFLRAVCCRGKIEAGLSKN